MQNLGNPDNTRARRGQHPWHFGMHGVHTATFGFMPAFRDVVTGETHLSTNADGSLAPIHLLDGIPDEWVVERNAQGLAVALRETIIPGYVRSGRFFTHGQLQAGLLDA